MERFVFNRSMKDIPIPPEDQYRKLLLSKTESFLNRIRWKTYFHLNPDKVPPYKETYGFKSSKTAPQVKELNHFEKDLADLVSSGIKFRPFVNSYQKELRSKVKEIQTCTNYLLAADKTTNIYKVSGNDYKKLLLDNVTKDYQQTTYSTVNEINDEAREIAEELKLGDRIEVFSEACAFVTIKDHKEHFERDKKCRLINPAKSQIGRISKQLLQKINKETREVTGLTQWQSTKAALDWFKKIPNKKRMRFMQMDICEFYPSINEKLLDRALDFASSQCKSPIPAQTRKIIKHARKSLLFTDDPNSQQKIPWTKKGGLFDVTMGAPDGAEICELVGLFLLNEVRTNIPDLTFGLYRDDGLGYHKARMPVRKMERIRKDLFELFKKHGLKITIEKPNLTQVNFLDVTLDLQKELFKPYRKPNDRPLYVHKLSNHPPNVIKAIPKSVNRRISDISSSAKEFDDAKGDYQAALNKSGHKHELAFQEPVATPTRSRTKKKREILWFNPPFNLAVATNVGAEFLKLVSKHFPKNHPLHCILNRNTIKVSYSCTKNMQQIIKGHNSKIVRGNAQAEKNRGCNCQRSKKHRCPIKDNCNQKDVIYHATVRGGNEDKKYIGSTMDFKKRWYQHNLSFRENGHKSDTTLAGYVWEAGLNPEPDIEWSILKTATPHVKGGRTCDLCLTEKLFISKTFQNPQYLNQRTELALKCRHRRGYLLTPPEKGSM